MAVSISNIIQGGQYVQQCCSGKSHRHTKGYIPRITASRHLIGRDSLVISLAVSINLVQKQEGFSLFSWNKGFSCTLRARHLHFSSQQVLVNLILLFSDCQSPLNFCRMTEKINWCLVSQRLPCLCRWVGEMQFSLPLPARP